MRNDVKDAVLYMYRMLEDAGKRDGRPRGIR